MKLTANTKEITLRRWRVVEVESRDGAKTRHFWGHDAAKNTGRASSAIQKFDKETMSATTQSSSVYRLAVLPGNSRLGKTAWEDWCKGSHIVAERDVTNEYLDISKVSTVGFERLNHSALDE